jgi:L-rhamnose mutarotase|tara:strand:- start:1585 stop:1923 length:339 start_codon:yes stop_codon:yes gene_type:complete
MRSNKHCLSIDLKNDDELISAYKAHHKNVWPEIIKSIKASGILSLEIYLVENRLFMIIEVNSTFSFEKMNEMDSKNQKVQEWENLMWKYQQGLPMSKPNEKWRLMEQIFQLD